MHSSDTYNIVIACKRISESKSVSKEALGIYDLEQVPHIVTAQGHHQEFKTAGLSSLLLNFVFPVNIFQQFPFILFEGTFSPIF